MRTAAWFAWPGWERLLIGWCACFHFGAGLVFAFTPPDVLETEGTRPVLAMAPQHVWSAVFFVAAVLAWGLTRSSNALLQMATWFVVFVSGGLWFTAFLLAALRSEISGLGTLVWFCLYGPWVVAALRVGLGRR